MLRFLLAVVIPSLGAGVIFSVLAGYQAEKGTLKDMATITEAIATATDQKFENWKIAIERLADGHVMVRDLDLESLHWMAERLAEDLGGWVVMTAADDVTFQYFNTLTGSASPILTNVNVSEVADAVARSRASGRPEISDVFLGPVARTAVVTATTTASASSGEEFLLTLSFEAQSLSEALARLNLPENFSVLLVDGSRRIVASSLGVGSSLFQDIPKWLDDMLEASSAGVTRGPRIHDVGVEDYQYAHQQLPGAPGWHVVVARPRDMIAKAALLNGMPLLGAFLVFLVMGTLELRRSRAERNEVELRITRQHLETERVLRGELQSSLERVHALEAARKKMLGILGHEMRTPVLSALAAIELGLLDENRKDGGGHLPLAVHGLQALLSLVDDILDLTRLDAGEFRLEFSTFRLSGVLEEAADILQPMAQRHGAVLVRDWPKADLEVVGDPKRLRQILINLLSNAVKYAPRQPITLSGGWSTNAEGMASVRLCVIDSGPGIPENKLGSLFEPFVRLEASESGSISGLGLGLSITKRLAEAMGGRLEASSRVGQGSTFCLSINLPLAKQADAGGNKLSRSSEDVSLEDLSILIVEDHQLQAALVEAVLIGLQAKVKLAATGRDALALAQAEQFDVILIDLGLPDMTGVELVKELRIRQSAAAHIALSANPASLSPEDRALFDDALSKTSGARVIAASVKGGACRR